LARFGCKVYTNDGILVLLTKYYQITAVHVHFKGFARGCALEKPGFCKGADGNRRDRGLQGIAANPAKMCFL
jgi:hypothetical protein